MVRGNATPYPAPMRPTTLRPLPVPPPFRILFADGPGADLVIAFSSVGHDPERVPSPEFVATATNGGRRALFVADESRSWANHPGFAPALQQALAHVGTVRRIATTGLSMGGFCALAAAEVLPVDVALAFSPQWSLRNETRWTRWTDALPPIRYPTAPIAARWTVLFHGALDDLPQALPFPQCPGLDHLIFPDLAHSSLVPHLKSRGVLAGLMDSALAGDRRRLLRIAASAGGRRR
ncbi:hypothetical protein [Paenirhodobacter sp.]|uniref:hypothetical protein n=1 Tax=Paenirhodobacter sp. TaxID=1965326 RepID=UPI003B3C7821